MGPYAEERALMQCIDVPKLRLPPLIDNARVKRAKNHDKNQDKDGIPSEQVD